MQQTRRSVTLREAAERLGTSISSIRRRIREGSLRAELVPGQFGDRWEIPLAVLEGLQDAPAAPGAPSQRAAEGPPEGLRGGPPEGLQPDVESGAIEQAFPSVSAVIAAEQTFHAAWTAENEAPPEALRRGFTSDLQQSAPQAETKPHRDSMEPLREGPPEGLRGGVPVPVHMETLRQLESASSRAQQAYDARDSAVDEARRLERQVMALQFELMNYRRALTEHAESLAQREVQTRDAEAKRQAAEQEALEEAARRQQLEAELATRPAAPAQPAPWWKRMFGAQPSS